MPIPVNPNPCSRSEPAMAQGAPLPAFLTRCNRRATRGHLPSEKHRGAVSFTTLAQCAVMQLLELSYPVESYAAWPAELTVRLRSHEEVTYWPAVGSLTANGLHILVDVIQQQDRIDRAKLDFDALLQQAAQDRGYKIILLDEADVQCDPRLPIARKILGYGGSSINDEQIFEVREVLARVGGALSLGDMHRRQGGCMKLVAAGCILAMRRRLVLTLDPHSEDACVLSTVGGARR